MAKQMQVAFFNTCLKGVAHVAVQLYLATKGANAAGAPQPASGTKEQ